MEKMAIHETDTNYMKINSFVFTGIVSIICCVSALAQPGKQFNLNAKQYFIDNLNSLDLSPLSNAQKCNLEQTIANDLDELNSSRAVLLYDSLILRTYSDPYLQLPFTFLEEVKTSKFHFVWIPSLKEMIYNVNSLYEQINDSIYSLKEPVGVIRIDAPLIDQLLNNKYLTMNEESFYKRLDVAESLMKEFLPTIYAGRISLSVFQTGMEQMLSRKELSKTDYGLIRNNLIEPIFNSDLYRFDAFRLNRVGYVLIVYCAANPKNEFKVELYFVPEKQRSWMSRGVSSKFRDCFQ